jgi:uncharacterized protein (TIGR02145 family)
VDSAWFLTSSGAQADYNNDPANSAIYGKLYNWYAVADPSGLCPTGWHVPTDSEWNQLVKFLDPGADTSVIGGTQSTIAGGMLKATGTLQAGTGLWEAPNTDASNLSGFSGLPSGHRENVVLFPQSSYLYNGTIGFLWSSTNFSSSNAKYCLLFYDKGEIGISNADKMHGYSVRCVRD